MGFLQENDRVRQMLREAFADVPCPNSFKESNSCGQINHEVCLKLRRDFYNYEPEEIQYMLPFILEDLIHTHTGDDIETEDAEYLILQLDPFGIDNELVRNNQLEQFSIFSKKQAHAICEWLKLARGWEDLKRFTHWVDTAIDYWCGRAFRQD